MTDADGHARTADVLSSAELAAIRSLLRSVPSDEQKAQHGVHEKTGDDEVLALKDAFVATVADLREDVDRHERKLNVAERRGDFDSPVSKEDLARAIARHKLLTRVEENVTAGLSGGGVDVATVRDHADTMGITLHYQTVARAFTELDRTWNAIHVEDGDPGPSGKSRHVVISAADISDELRDATDEDITKLAQAVRR